MEKRRCTGAQWLLLLLFATVVTLILGCTSDSSSGRGESAYGGNGGTAGTNDSADGGSTIGGGQGGGTGGIGSGGSAGIVAGSGGGATGGTQGEDAAAGSGGDEDSGANDADGANCGPPWMICDSVCTDVRYDAANCGACGTVCGVNRYCDNGTCVCAQALLDCGDDCVNPTSNENCGACDNSCTGGAFCNKVPGMYPQCTCPWGQFFCNGSCVPATGQHCTGCNESCSPGQECQNWTCVDQCTNAIDCSGYCSDNPNYDDSNCGACGIVCTGGQACVAGSCTCLYGTVMCNGLCTSLTSDANCGACGNVCQGKQVCDYGACICPNPADVDCGNGRCTNVLIDAHNCGICGIECGFGHHCENGTCVADGVCPPTAPDLCDSTCTDLQTDQTNCGTCGHACDAGMGWYCSSGSCVQGAPPTCEAHYELATCFEWLETLGYTMYVCTGSPPPAGLSCLLYYSDYTSTWAYCCK